MLWCTSRFTATGKCPLGRGCCNTAVSADRPDKAFSDPVGSLPCRRGVIGFASLFPQDCWLFCFSPYMITIILSTFLAFTPCLSTPIEWSLTYISCSTFLTNETWPCMCLHCSTQHAAIHTFQHVAYETYSTLVALATCIVALPICVRSIC